MGCRLSAPLQNLMRSDMTVVTPKSPTHEYDPDSRGQVTLYSKFFRVIELAADFLEVRRFLSVTSLERR